MISEVNIRSLDEPPVIRQLNTHTETTGITLVVETPIPQCWTTDGYVWSWEYKAIHSVTAATEQLAMEQAIQKIQWINQWELRKVTESFQKQP